MTFNFCYIIKLFIVNFIQKIIIPYRKIDFKKHHYYRSLK